MRSYWIQTRSGTKHLPTSRICSPSARPTSTTKQQTADSRAWHMSATTHPPAASPPPTPRVTSRATSTSRAWRNHLQWLESIALWMQPHAHLYHRPSIPSPFYKPNLRSNASRYRKSCRRMQVSWQHSPRAVAVATAAVVGVVEAKVEFGTKPHGKKKTLPKLQQGGHPRSRGVFLP